MTANQSRIRIPAAAPDNPHELLGVPAGERDVVVIIEAARRRLAIVRGSGGSEVAVIRELVLQITAARDAMLEAARPPGCHASVGMRSSLFAAIADAHAGADFGG